MKTFFTIFAALAIGFFSGAATFCVMQFHYCSFMKDMIKHLNHDHK
jgi:hypothetical protein